MRRRDIGRNERRLRVCLLVLAATALPSPASAVAAQEPSADATPPDEPVAERCDAPEFRQFDFWIGSWEVRGPDGDLAGHNEIRRVAGGCALLERWRGAGGGTGVSVNTYDPDLGRWTQRWVGAGSTLWLEGGLEETDDGRRMVLSGTRSRSTPRGEVLDRLTWTPLPEGDVVQVWEISPDGGVSWEEVFRGRYTVSETRDSPSGTDFD